MENYRKYTGFNSYDCCQWQHIPLIAWPEHAPISWPEHAPISWPEQVDDDGFCLNQYA